MSSQELEERGSKYSYTWLKRVRDTDGEVEDGKGGGKIKKSPGIGSGGGKTGKLEAETRLGEEGRKGKGLWNMKLEGAK